MREPRRTWRKIIGSRGIAPGSPDEDAFIQAHFPGVSIKTFRVDLSRGFSGDFADRIERVCSLAGQPFSRDDWIRPSLRKGFGNPDLIRYTGTRIVDSASLYASLDQLYSRAEAYECVRVGGLFSRNRDSLIDVDGVLQANPESKRLPYVKRFWERLKKGSLEGSAVHFIRTVDRLPDLWACAELLRDFGLHESNRLYLGPVSTPPGPADPPVMGVRIIDDRWTLLSIPPLKPDESRYSSWIDSGPLADFQGHYVRWARLASFEIASQHPQGIEGLMRRTFSALKSVEKRSAHFSPIGSFSQATAIKNRMIELAKEGSWYPVMA